MPFQKGTISLFKGKKHTKEANEKNRLAHLGKIPWNKNTKGICKPNSGSFKKGVSASPKTQFQEGRTFKHLEETKRKIGLANSKGGITPINNLIRTSFKMKLWKLEVFRKNGFRCMDCGEKELVSGKLEADHILRFVDYPHLRFEILNGQTLCIPCHKQKTKFDRTGKMELNSPIYV